ncbi:MAG: 3-phosphoshikimate 1-carboxyvinyltransferase [Eubacterium sp.]
MKEITITASKSDAHRAWICAYLSGMGGHPCRVSLEGGSDDISATVSCMEALKKAGRGGAAELHCRESGSTLRFLLPVTAALGVQGKFYPEGRLPQRPLSPLYEELEKHGCRLSAPGTVPFEIQGQLTPGSFTIPGNVSSQYISGLLFALPLLEEGSVIEIPGGLQSAGYVKMTERTLQRFGIQFRDSGSRIEVPGKQTYAGPDVYEVEGDWSNAAFWMTMGAIGEEPVAVHGLQSDTAQGDSAMLELLQKFGADAQMQGDTVTVRPSAETLHGIEIDASNIPDIVPELALTACLAEGVTVISHAERLRMKESDRLTAVSAVLNSLGADVEEKPDGLVIRGSGGQKLNGGEADGFHDHRIVMMAAAASAACRNPVTILGSEAASKSYPTFFEEMKKSGLDGNVIRN